MSTDQKRRLSGDRTGLTMSQLHDGRAINRDETAEEGGDERELDILRDIADLAYDVLTLDGPPWL